MWGHPSPSSGGLAGGRGLRRVARGGPVEGGPERVGAAPPPRVGGAPAGGGAEPLFAGGASPPHPRAGEAGRRGPPFDAHPSPTAAATSPRVAGRESPSRGTSRSPGLSWKRNFPGTPAPLQCPARARARTRSLSQRRKPTRRFRAGGVPGGRPTAAGARGAEPEKGRGGGARRSAAAEGTADCAEPMATARRGGTKFPSANDAPESPEPLAFPQGLGQGLRRAAEPRCVGSIPVLASPAPRAPRLRVSTPSRPCGAPTASQLGVLCPPLAANKRGSEEIRGRVTHLPARAFKNLPSPGRNRTSALVRDLGA